MAFTTSPTTLDIALGQRIRLRRKSLRLSQTDLANAIGLTFQQIQKYERGANRVSFSRLVNIAHALECRVTELIGDLDDANVARPAFRNDAKHLRIEGGAELLAAYAATPRPLQTAIRKLVVTLASEQHRRKPAADDLSAPAA